MPTKRLLKHFSILAMGGGIAQGVGILASPILTRLYSPEDYAVLTVFLALVGTFVPFICGKYEVAIVMAGTERYAKDVVALCLWLAGALSLLLAIPAILFGEPIARMLNCEDLQPWLPLAALMVFFGGAAMTCRYLANRGAEYATISRYMLVQAICSIALNLVFGFAAMGSAGLVLANVAATAMGVSWLAWKSRAAISCAELAWGRHLGEVGARYRDFPLYNASSSILDALTLAMPVFFISRLYDSDTVGQYGFLMRLAQAPLALVSGAVTQVHLKHVADLVRSRVPVRPYLARITAILAGLVVLPAICAMLWGGPLFAWAFGQRWQPAGEYLGILMPSLALQFVVSTLSPTCGATGNNRVAALWKTLSFLVTLGMFLLVAPGRDARGLMWALASTNVVLYILYYVAIWYAAGRPRGSP